MSVAKLNRLRGLTEDVFGLLCSLRGSQTNPTAPDDFA